MEERSALVAEQELEKRALARSEAFAEEQEAESRANHRGSQWNKWNAVISWKI